MSFQVGRKDHDGLGKKGVWQIGGWAKRLERGAPIVQKLDLQGDGMHASLTSIELLIMSCSHFLTKCNMFYFVAGLQQP